MREPWVEDEVDNGLDDGDVDLDGSTERTEDARRCVGVDGVGSRGGGQLGKSSPDPRPCDGKIRVLPFFLVLECPLFVIRRSTQKVGAEAL